MQGIVACNFFVKLKCSVLGSEIYQIFLQCFISFSVQCKRVEYWLGGEFISAERVVNCQLVVLSKIYIVYVKSQCSVVDSIV